MDELWEFFFAKLKQSPNSRDNRAKRHGGSSSQEQRPQSRPNITPQPTNNRSPQKNFAQHRKAPNPPGRGSPHVRFGPNSR